MASLSNRELVAECGTVEDVLSEVMASPAVYTAYVQDDTFTREFVCAKCGFTFFAKEYAPIVSGLCDPCCFEKDAAQLRERLATLFGVVL